MTFLNLKFLPLIVLAIFLMWIATFRLEKKYFQWILDHWFFRRSKLSQISSFLYFLGFALILSSLLDLRGPEKRVTGKVSDQKTIILIDTSASMLAEDVRPNRFEKAILLAKHFMKKAAGHQISVVVFSDGQKRIIPFTKDRDLLEARLDTLDRLNLERGGTGLSMAIQESIQYFINAEQRPFGNILILTDAEQTEEGISLEVPDGITVGVVGIGTAKGGPIPIRDNRGGFKGNKKHLGKTVITKLDENFLKSLGKELAHFQYWIASSYTIPTEDVLSFFNRELKTKTAKDDFRIRPVLANYLILPGVILLSMAFGLKNFKSFSLLILFSLVLSGRSYARTRQIEEPQEADPVKSELALELEEQFAQNKLDLKGQKKLAEELLKSGFPNEAKALYQETLSKSLMNDNVKDVFNYGAAQFKGGDTSAGMSTYADLMNYLEQNPSPENQELLAKAQENVLKAIQQEEQKKKEEKNQESGEDKNQDSKDQKQDQSKGGEGGDENKSSKQNKSSEGSDKNKDQGKSDQDKSEKDKDQKGKNQEGENKDKGKDKGKDKDKDKEKDKNKKNKNQGKGKGGKEKMPAILKQLMSDDNQLQKKVIDAETVKRKTREKKDW